MPAALAANWPAPMSMPALGALSETRTPSITPTAPPTIAPRPASNLAAISVEPRMKTRVRPSATSRPSVAFSTSSRRSLPSSAWRTSRRPEGAFRVAAV
ncbi:MAG: hypothetical protein IPP07_24670 [Holophagales bacterium]|nr:hypothetical protein [Holophagales bacterium]